MDFDHVIHRKRPNHAPERLRVEGSCLSCLEWLALLAISELVEHGGGVGVLDYPGEWVVW
jgi:hypothetical protein